MEPLLHPDDFKLEGFELAPFTLGRLEILEAVDESVISTETEETTLEDVERDIWIGADLLSEPLTPLVRSWDSYNRLDLRESCSLYISEAGPAVFDAALEEQALRQTGGEAGYVVQTEVFTRVCSYSVSTKRVLTFDSRFTTLDLEEILSSSVGIRRLILLTQRSRALGLLEPPDTQSKGM